MHNQGRSYTELAAEYWPSADLIRNLVKLPKLCKQLLATHTAPEATSAPTIAAIIAVIAIVLVWAFRNKRNKEN